MKRDLDHVMSPVPLDPFDGRGARAHAPCAAIARLEALNNVAAGFAVALALRLVLREEDPR
ncbi:MAG: hypothetical protein ACLP1X_27390 [Polyangiaceae bacterium]